MSRIDRFWSTTPTPVLLARLVAAWAHGTVYDRVMPGDRVAVSLRWHSARRARRQAVPQRVADHPNFLGCVESFSQEVDLELEEGPLDQLSLAAEVLQVAAR